MSNNQEKEKKAVSKEEQREFIKGLSVITIIIIGLIAVLYPVISKPKSGDEATKQSIEGGYVEGADYSDSNITTYKYDSNVLHGEELSTAISDIQSNIDGMRSTNAYFQVQIGESEFDFYIYNKQGECLAQTYDGGTTVIYRKDGEQSIAYGGDSGTLMTGNDVDILSLIQGVVDLAATDKEGVTFFDMVFADGEDTGDFKEYRVDIVGREAFLDVYKDINPEMGEGILDTITSQVKEQFDQEYEPHVIYMFYLDNTQETPIMTTACYLVIDGEESLNWVQDGYLELGDWQLGEEWYTTDFESITKEDSLSMVENLIKQIEQVLQDYAIENNIPMNGDIETESDTGTETGKAGESASNESLDESSEELEDSTEESSDTPENESEDNADNAVEQSEDEENTNENNELTPSSEDGTQE